MKWFSIFFIVVAFMFSSIVSGGAKQIAEPTEIISISHTRDSAEVENILFHLGAYIEPAFFTLRGENPRLVIDFINSYYKGQNPIPLSDGILATSIRSGIHQKPVPKTRIVIDLSKSLPVHYTHFFDKDTKTLAIKLEHQNVKPDEKPAGDPLISAQKLRQAEFDARPLYKKPIPPVFFPDDNADSVTKESQSEVVKQEKTGIAGIEEPGNERQEADVRMEVATVEQGLKKRESLSLRPELLGLSFDDSSNRGEMVLFHLNDFFSPTVSALEKGNPRVFCDFSNMLLGKDVEASLIVNGRFIERIGAAQLDNPDKVRVVLELVPDRDYSLQQVFFKNDNLFVLIVNELSAETSNKKN